MTTVDVGLVRTLRLRRGVVVRVVTPLVCACDRSTSQTGVTSGGTRVLTADWTFPTARIHMRDAA